MRPVCQLDAWGLVLIDGEGPALHVHLGDPGGDAFGYIDEALRPEVVQINLVLKIELCILPESPCDVNFFREDPLSVLGQLEILLQSGEFGVQILNGTGGSSQILALGCKLRLQPL